MEISTMFPHPVQVACVIILRWNLNDNLRSRTGINIEIGEALPSGGDLLK
jgi:hypothetical protein